MKQAVIADLNTRELLVTTLPSNQLVINTVIQTHNVRIEQLYHTQRSNPAFASFAQPEAMSIAVTHAPPVAHASPVPHAPPELLRSSTLRPISSLSTRAWAPSDQEHTCATPFPTGHVPANAAHAQIFRNDVSGGTRESRTCARDTHSVR